MLRIKLLFFIAMVVGLTTIGYAAVPTKNMTPSGSVAASVNAGSYVVDDFRDGDISSSPTWWTMGDIIATVGPNTETSEPEYVGKISLRLQGKGRKYLVGGIGTYLALDGTRFNSLEMIVYGNGAKSGRIVVELYDDDNRNYVIEPEPNLPGGVAVDDKFIYEFPVDWIGWKRMSIPLFMFYDANPKVGDDVWNPSQKGGSGGLVQMQLVVSSTEPRGKVDIKIDSIRFYNDADPKFALPSPDAEILDTPSEENLDFNIQAPR
ncbi:hypothetical protein EBR96_00870 [bacterium]|nr:hypothetical protein [bacterium]